ncbi:MAG: ABC transporter substrate-binding protein, partial [Deltaproteobacteria bacterium]|nr:ABC transporter substrate-binding protein [Deltaproteobacteria bacterium]
LDLTILPGGPDSPSLDFLKDGRADFATLWLSTGIQARSEGVALVNIAQIVQRSALMLVAKKSGGIRTPRDMNGKKVGLWGPIFQVQPRAFFRKYDLRVTIVPQAFSVNLFLRGGVDVASAMWYNEYHTILNCGVNPEELIPFFFHEHGLNYPEDGLYALESTYRRDPGLCEAFVRGAIEGWRYAFAHPEETLDLVMMNLKRQYVPANRAHQRWMLERMRNLILPGDNPPPMGKLLSRDYDRVAKGLHEGGLIRETPPYSRFHRECVAHDEK